MIQKRWLLAVGLTMLTAACGSATATSVSGGSPLTATPPSLATTPAPQATVPTVADAPHTALTGGQPLKVRLTGFPPHSSLLSTSWISATEGWALAAQPCAAGTCTRLAHTTDGGQRWQVLPDPPAAIQEGTTDCTVNACVSQVSFANSTTGYLYGPALLMTTDGGLTWHVQPGLQTGTLTIAGGQVYRGAFTSDGCPGPCQPSLQEAPAGSAHWRTIIGQITEPDRGNFGQIAVSGPDVLVDMIGSPAGPLPAGAIVYRSTDGGATWARQAADPCSGLGPGGAAEEHDLIGLAAAPGGFFAGLCYRRESMGTFVITSADAGATWQATAAAPPGQALGLVTAISPDAIAVATEATGGNGTWTSRLLVTTDGGRHWDVAATDVQGFGGGGNAPAWIGFETPLAGQWLGDAHGIWHTADGGLHWTRTAIP